MRKNWFLALACVVLAAACSADVTDTVAPGSLTLSAKGGNGGSGRGSTPPVGVDLTGGFEGALEQVTLVVDSRKRIVLEGAGDCGTFGCMDYAFDLTASYDADACTFNPADLDAATQQDLIDHLDDAIQNRTFYADIDKSGGLKSRVGGVYFDDANGGPYRVWIEDASAEEGPTDHFVFTGGTAWTVKEGSGGIYCPFTGAQHLTVDR